MGTRKYCKLKDTNKQISEALGVDFVSDGPVSDAPIVLADKINIEESKKAETLRGDFSLARTNIRDLLNTGMDALDGIVKVATASDSPRAYEVLTNMMKTLSEMNKDLIDIHDKLNSAETKKVTVKNTTNNSIYVGSTSDLQNLINKERSPMKILEDE